MDKLESGDSLINIWPSFADVAICAMIVFLIYALYLISMLPHQIRIGEITENEVSKFIKGSAELPPFAIKDLDKMYNEIVYGKYANEWQDTTWIIIVAGHTDNDPISTYKYQSNWELSNARAMSVVKYFISKGIPETRIRPIGYGEFHPKVKNDKESNKAQNRRIEIILFKSNGKI